MKKVFRAEHVEMSFQGTLIEGIVNVDGTAVARPAGARVVIPAKGRTGYVFVQTEEVA